MTATVDWKLIREKAGPYPQNAFEFVRQGLEHTARIHHGVQTPAHTDGSPDGTAVQEAAEDDTTSSGRHVSGQQLCLGLKDLAIRKYGRLARLVLSRWSIRRTDDFGRIVFAMIDAGLMRKTDSDRLDDFSNVFDFEDAFEAGDN